MLQASKIAELYRERLNACIKCLSVKACAFLIAQFLMCLPFSFFFQNSSLPPVCSVTSDHYRKLGIINDIRQGKMPLSSSEENLISGSAQHTSFLHF